MQILEILPRNLNLPTASEQRVILSDISWEQYTTFIDSFIDQYPSLRVTYLEGVLEIMSTSNEHELLKTIIARLLEMYAVERNIELNGYGNTTFRDEAVLRGLEPDECYCFGELKRVPDIALEIYLSSGGISKLSVYEGLRIPEVWFWQVKKQQWKLYRLKDRNYQEIRLSEFLPDLDFALLAHFIQIITESKNQTQGITAYRDRLRTES
jgi:Uma2 family endonuclease